MASNKEDITFRFFFNISFEKCDGDVSARVAMSGSFCDPTTGGVCVDVHDLQYHQRLQGMHLIFSSTCDYIGV